MLGRRFESGVELSGGEWQRVALARAYLRDAQLLILDEPTAALDARSELEVFERFAELTTGKMALLISHRFSTVRMADRIVVLEGGRLVEEGTHPQLMALGGRYARCLKCRRQATADVPRVEDVRPRLYDRDPSQLRPRHRAQEAQPPTPPSRCASYADRVAPGWHVAHKPEGAGSFGRRIDATAQSLDQLYVILDARPVPTYLPGETARSVARAAAKSAAAALRALPRSHTIRKNLAVCRASIRDHENDEPRIVTVADAYLQATGSEYHARRDQDLYHAGAAIRCTGAARAMGSGSGAQVSAAGRDHHAGERRAPGSRNRTPRPAPNCSRRA